jgi:hypothetical protein
LDEVKSGLGEVLGVVFFEDDLECNSVALQKFVDEGTSVVSLNKKYKLANKVVIVKNNYQNKELQNIKSLIVNFKKLLNVPQI